MTAYVDDYVDEYAEVDLGRLEIGRVGIETDLFDPYQITQSQSPTGRNVSISGHVKETTTLADALHLRRELLYQTRTRHRSGVVAVKSLIDPDIDGFYTLENASVDAHAKLASMQHTGFFPFRIQLEAVPGVIFQSSLTGGVLPNDHGTVTGEGFIAPPIGFTSYTPSLPYVSRVGDEGTLTTFRGVTTRPTWTVAPSNFYLGAAKIRIDSKLVAGLETPQAAIGWQLDNSLVRVTRVGDGSFTVQHHGPTTWGTAKNWRFQENLVNLGAWDHFVILRNDPEAVSIRLIQDRVGTVAAGRRTLDLTLRRGSRFVTAFYTTDSSANLYLINTDGGSVQTTLWGANRGANDADGNRWVVGSKQTVTTHGTVGITAASATTFDTFIGSAIGGSSAVSGDAPADLYNQYIHHIHERVSPVARSAR